MVALLTYGILLLIGHRTQGFWFHIQVIINASGRDSGTSKDRAIPYPTTAAFSSPACRRPLIGQKVTHHEFANHSSTGCWEWLLSSRCRSFALLRSPPHSSVCYVAKNGAVPLRRPSSAGGQDRPRTRDRPEECESCLLASMADPVPLCGRAPGRAPNGSWPIEPTRVTGGTQTDLPKTIHPWPIELKRRWAGPGAQPGLVTCG